MTDNSLQRRTDGLAIASFVCGLCGFGLIPVILGHLSLNRMKRDGTGGIGFAVVGMILGYAALAVTVVALVVIAGTVIWSVTA